MLESKEYAKKNSPKPNLNLSSVPEHERKKEPEGLEHQTVETGRQRLNYGVGGEPDRSLPQSNLLENAGLPLAWQSDSQIQESPLSPHEQEMPVTGYSHVVLRHKVSRNIALNSIDEGESPTSSPSDENLPSENIAFMITKTAVQVLSSGEVHDIVSQKGEDVHTVNIDSKKEKESQQDTLGNLEGEEEPVVCLDKKPVIIIFDEPMDIKSAYKRLSTIFEECDEELEKMMTEDKIEEEAEEDEEDYDDTPGARHVGITQADDNRRPAAGYSTNQRIKFGVQSPSDSSTHTKHPEGQETDNTDLGRPSYIYGPRPDSKLDAPDAKKKFKFKFPKKQLAALTQAIRTGTKTGKKTLQVVVYEEEEEDGTVKQHKEAKRFEIPSSHPDDGSRKQEPNTTQTSRTDEIRKNTYRTLDSLEQTIKQLESTISEMSPKSVSEAPSRLEGTTVHSLSTPKESIVLEESNADVESPPSIPPTSRKVL